LPTSSTQPVSALLAEWQAGSEAALEALVQVVYPKLRRLAHQYIQKERAGHTLQSTAVVHEAYLRLVKQAGAKFENKAHFFAICAQLMRQILVEYARRRGAAKRNGGCRLTLIEGIEPIKGRGMDLIALDDALRSLAQLDAQQSRMVELRFFAGLSIGETAQVLNISPATVKRHWALARLWLHHEISKALQR
jgi:RNA polymerase sigma factor (TIGR02999 family)